MQFGNLEGLVNGTEQVVGYTSLAASASSISITGLNGDEDGWYTVIARQVYATSNSTLNMYFDADSTAANYGYRGITVNNTTVANINSTASTTRLCSVTTTTTIGFSVLRLYAKSGAVRLMNGINVCDISGTIVTQIETIGSVYAPSSSNIGTMVFQPSAGHLGIGTEIIVLKSNNFTGGTPTGTINTPYIKGAWVRVGSQVLTGTASTVTFSGLDGDRDVIYYYTHSIKAKTATYSGKIQFNADVGTNYGGQYLQAANTTIAGLRRTGYEWIPMSYNGATTGQLDQASVLIFAKKGFVRPTIMWNAEGIATTTVTGINVLGGVWNSADNITSIKIDPRAGAACDFEVGSQFDLYALRPNG